MLMHTINFGKQSSDCLFELARGKLVLEEIIGSNNSHRDKIEQAFGSPDLEVQLGKVGPPNKSPAEQQDTHKDPSRYHNYKLCFLVTLKYLIPNCCLDCKHRSLNVLSYRLVFHELCGNYRKGHCCGVLR